MKTWKLSLFAFVLIMLLWACFATNIFVEPVSMKGMKNWIDTSTFLEKITVDNKVLYKDIKWEYWSDDFLNWKIEKTYKIAPQNLNYTTIMNLKLQWYFNDFQQSIRKTEANEWEEHLTRIYDRFWINVTVIIAQSRENNEFEEIYYSILGKNKGIDCLLLYVEDENKFYIKSLDALNINQEDLTKMVSEFPIFNTTQSQYILKTFKSWFLDLYLKANSEEQKWLNDEVVKTRVNQITQNEDKEIVEVEVPMEVKEKQTFNSNYNWLFLLVNCWIAFTIGVICSNLIWDKKF